VDVLDHWPLVVLDLHELYGADIDDVTLVRPWPWWRDRIWGLLGADTRLRRALTPPPRPPTG